MKVDNKMGVYILIDKQRSDEENIVYKIGYSSKVQDRINQIKKTYSLSCPKNE